MHHKFCAGGNKRGVAEIKRAVHLGVGRKCWIKAGYSEKVECDKCLGEELVP